MILNKHKKLFFTNLIFDRPEQLKTLASESLNSAVLDSGATNTVAGEVCYNCYITSLNENDKQKIKHHKPRNTY